MSNLRKIYLLLAVLGLGLPMVFDPNWVIGLGLFSFNWSNVIAFLALVSFASNECVARKYYLPLLALPVAALFGLGAGLPLYLFLRSKPLD